MEWWALVLDVLGNNSPTLSDRFTVLLGEVDQMEHYCTTSTIGPVLNNKMEWWALVLDVLGNNSPTLSDRFTVLLGEADQMEHYCTNSTMGPVLNNFLLQQKFFIAYKSSTTLYPDGVVGCGPGCSRKQLCLRGSQYYLEKQTRRSTTVLLVL